MIKSATVPSIPLSRNARKKLNLSDERFDAGGYLKIRTRKEARELSVLYANIEPEAAPPASDLFGAAYIITAWRLLLDLFAEGPDPYEKGALAAADMSAVDRDAALIDIIKGFPDEELWHGRSSPREALKGNSGPLSGRETVIRRWTLVSLSADDPAFSLFRELFIDPESDGTSGDNEKTTALWKSIETSDPTMAPREPEEAPPLATLRKPVQAAPNSVKDQLLYILTRWGDLLGDWAAGLVGALDMIEEETRPRFGGPGPVQRPGFSDLDDTARFSSDDEWMPRVVMLAKNVLVWMAQLSQSHGHPIQTLDAIPDEELALLASRGFNALWLIGLWERSNASREIKRRMGNPEAAASAYSLYGYDIAGELGGWSALENLRGRAEAHGIRLSSDMVPNHVGLDSDWVRHYPERLLSADYCPYPAYGFNSDNLSEDGSVDIRMEDHYWDHSDAAVVFQRTDNSTGETRYVYHGNDGTTMPWNDTAQIDFLNPEAREAVIQDILHVARNFSIIRFDAAMVLARKHIRRLWFPAPGSGGAIPSRSEFALSDEDFMAACPEEFWREVVDRVASEVPGTLLLAEAFWMMEGYFVRVLGMHRVYNSAFMNMLRDQKNNEYRDMIKETLAFDPGILQRFVNFMNNPDEETAVEQFGNDDRYFAACTLLATLPGLPMFGHGQIEGLSEKYGMEYVRAYRDEQPDSLLVARHEREIFPLLARRSLFAGAPSFRLYDLVGDDGINENVFAYSNSDGYGRTLVIVNNSFERATGRIRRAAPVNIGDMKILNENLGSALGLGDAAGDNWFLMRDHVGGLWYLRSVESLKSEGLSVMIDGFGRQVFMDFRIEKETLDGLWGKLAAELAGTGTPDPDAAVAEIRLRPIHTVLEDIFKENLITRLAESIRRGRRPDAGNNFSEQLTLLAKRHSELIGLQGLSGSTFDETTELIRKRLAGSAGLWRFFGGGVRRRMKRRFTLPEWDEAVLLATWSLLASLAAMVSDRPPIEVWDSWDLEKWIRQGRLPPGTDGIIQPLKMTLSAGSWMEGLPKSGEALSGLMSDRLVRETCGVNAWDGVLWYKMEGWNDTVRSLILTAAADTDSGRERRRKARVLKAILKKWHRADIAADYHVDRLLAAAR